MDEWTKRGRVWRTLVTCHLQHARRRGAQVHLAGVPRAHHSLAHRIHRRLGDVDSRGGHLFSFSSCVWGEGKRTKGRYDRRMDDFRFT